MTSAADRTSATAAAIRRAALDEFAAFGYRRSSMESVARRAGISRATLYLHWNGKEELFRGLVAQLHDEHIADMRTVIDDPALDIETRMVRVLEARFARFVTLTSASASAAELYDQHNRLCGDIAAAAEQRAGRMLDRMLRRAVDSGELDLARSGLTVRQLATVLTGCAHAAKGDDPTTATPSGYRERLARTVRALLHGVGGPAVRAERPAVQA